MIKGVPVPACGVERRAGWRVFEISFAQVELHFDVRLVVGHVPE